MIDALSGGAIGSRRACSPRHHAVHLGSIIFSLLVKVMPPLEALSKEGAAGQTKINQWTRCATVPIASSRRCLVVTDVLPATQPAGLDRPALDAAASVGSTLVRVLALTAGTIFVMWIGEQITEYGVGNGISLIIMAGIVARMPQRVRQLLGAGTGRRRRRCCSARAVLRASCIVVVYITRARGASRSSTRS